MAKKHFVRKHVIKHQPKKHTSNQFKGVLPSAYGSPTPNIPSTAGKFNPPGWNQKHDYGTTTKFTQGNTSTQQNPFTQGPPSAAGSPETKLTGGFGVGTGNLYQPSTPPSKGQQPKCMP